MLHFETVWDENNRFLVLLTSFTIAVAIALVDWLTKPYFSLGFLYLFPIMLAAGFLPRSFLVLFGAMCAVLSEVFSSLERSYVRLSFSALALIGCGLFVSELVRNRRLTLQSQQRLKALVETSPAAIITVDERGFIELANRAATDLLVPRNQLLIGNPVAAFLPELHHALRWEDAPQFRASMQCRGHCGNGESFMADVWFSTYIEGSAPKLAAIIAPTPEESTAQNGYGFSGEERARPSLTSREVEVLRALVQGLSNKEIGAKMDISESSVKNTLQQLFAKTEVRTRAQLVRVALESFRDLL